MGARFHNGVTAVRTAPDGASARTTPTALPLRTMPAAKNQRVMTGGMIVLTIAVVVVVAGVIIGAVATKGTGHVKTARELGHTLMPVTAASVHTCLTDQGIVVEARTATKLTAMEPGAKPVQLTFAKDFDEASATAQPGRALNNVVLSTDVSDLTQLEIYAFDHCIVTPGEKGGKGATPTKKAPTESVTS